MKTPSSPSDLLVREARERREPVAEIVMGKGWPYAAARRGDRGARARGRRRCCVLAKPIDEAAVRKLSDKARGAVLLSDGKTPVHRDGRRAPSATLLRAAVGGETQGPDLRAGGAAPGGGRRIAGPRR